MNPVVRKQLQAQLKFEGLEPSQDKIFNTSVTLEANSLTQQTDKDGNLIKLFDETATNQITSDTLKVQELIT